MYIFNNSHSTVVLARFTPILQGTVLFSLCIKRFSTENIFLYKKNIRISVAPRIKMQ